VCAHITFSTDNVANDGVALKEEKEDTKEFHHNWLSINTI
jgi:hypothetical protein